MKLVYLCTILSVLLLIPACNTATLYLQLDDSSVEPLFALVRPI